MTGLRAIVTLVVAVTITSVLLQIASQEKYRYSIGYGTCLRYVKNNLPEHIDIAALGGSRMLTLFMPEEIEAAGRAVLGKPLVARSLAKSWYGPDYEYQLLLDAYRTGAKIDTLLIQFEPQRKEVFHPHAYSMLEPRVIVDSYRNMWLDPSISIDLLSFVFRSSLERVRDLVFSEWKESFAKYESQKGLDSKTCYPRDYKVNQAKLKKQIALFQEKGFRERSFDVSSPEFTYSDYYYKQIIKLAELNNTQVVFVKVARINTPGLREETVESIKVHYGVPIIQMPVALREQLVQTGYRDGSHLHKPGRELVLPWLMRELTHLGAF